MSGDTKQMSGGCQCGAIRYRVEGEPLYPHLCHCRMCQKASGNFFMSLFAAERKNFSWTRGEPSWFHSSTPVRRGFCENCGTPLAFDTVGADSIAIAHGSLDDVSAVVPIEQSGVEGRVSFFNDLGHLPESVSDRSDLPGGIDDVSSSNRQHPDHDTDNWPETTNE